LNRCESRLRRDGQRSEDDCSQHCQCT
jgi:hypothetical protein